jgi:hypothetical protein
MAVAALATLPFVRGSASLMEVLSELQRPVRCCGRLHDEGHEIRY